MNEKQNETQHCLHEEVVYLKEQLAAQKCMLSDALAYSNELQKEVAHLKEQLSLHQSKLIDTESYSKKLEEKLSQLAYLIKTLNSQVAEIGNTLQNLDDCIDKAED
ncbi:hypothetical protein [Thermoflexibacter ruber]|uniref:Uncharacterized protein n=1 Tax=Thermoflexibacter ruber TaxID=1003 RepID=A0A1I2BJ30_9BACT|nr:hypothetical protein [Thermoflexibacter ruber]SFE56181.1 hypothetical protein SAMN04488541_100337 [Thermoflexibacter ruber]